MDLASKLFSVPEIDHQDVTDLSNWPGGLRVELKCFSAHISYYRFQPKQPVIFTSKGICIAVPLPHSPTETILQHIPYHDMEKIVAHFYCSTASVICIYVTNAMEDKMISSLYLKANSTTTNANDVPGSEELHMCRIILKFAIISESNRDVLNEMWSSGASNTPAADEEVLVGSAGLDPHLANEKLIEIKEAPEPTPSRLLLVYPDGKGGIPIYPLDYMCLTSGHFLNDTIVDFYLKWLHLNVVPEDERERTFIFSSFFYSQLTKKVLLNGKSAIGTAEQRYARVQKWTKKVNIFEKDFIIIPINKESHWFVAIICFPGQNDVTSFNGNWCDLPNKILPFLRRKLLHMASYQGLYREQLPAIKQPLILIFDSLKTLSKSDGVAGNLRAYLTCEFATKLPHLDRRSFTEVSMPGHYVDVAQQHNSCDCGLYLLQYVECFFTKPLQDYRLPIAPLYHWFDMLTIMRKRKDIVKLLQKLINEKNQPGKKITLSKIKLGLKSETPVQTIHTPDAIDRNNSVVVVVDPNTVLPTSSLKYGKRRMDYRGEEANVSGCSQPKIFKST